MKTIHIQGETYAGAYLSKSRHITMLKQSIICQHIQNVNIEC